MNDKTVREIIAEWEQGNGSPYSLRMALGLTNDTTAHGWSIELFTSQDDVGDLVNEEPEPMFQGSFLNRLAREFWWSKRQDRNRAFAEWAEKRGKKAQRNGEKNAYYWAAHYTSI